MDLLFKNVNFTSSSMKETKFKKSQLNNTYYMEADFSKVNFDECEMMASQFF